MRPGALGIRVLEKSSEDATPKNAPWGLSSPGPAHAGSPEWSPGTPGTEGSLAHGVSCWLTSEPCGAAPSLPAMPARRGARAASGLVGSAREGPARSGGAD